MSKNFNSTTNLPDGWRWVKLGELCEEKTGTRDPRLQPTDTFRYVDISIVDNTQKRILDASVLFGKDAPSRARQVINAGDIIVSTTRPNLNAVALVPYELNNQICSTGFCVLRSKKELDRNYLFAYVRSPDFVKNLSDLVKGALYPAVTDKQVKAQVIPLPPLPEQKRIAAILNEQMAAAEKARAAAEAQRVAAKALPGAYLRKVFNYKTGDKLHEGWRWVRLGEVCEVKGGKRLPAAADFTKETTTFPYIRVVDFKNGSIDMRNLKYLSQEVQVQISQYIINRADVYISIAGTIGICGVIPDELDGANLTENAARLIIKDKTALHRDYLFKFLNSPMGQLQIKQKTNAVGQPKLALERAKTIELLLPPLPEQRRIAAIIDEQMAEADKLYEFASGQLGTIKSLPAVLLRQAFGGGL